MTQITVVGNATRDPELRFTNSGTAVTKFGIAVNRGKDDNTSTDFYDITCWEDQAEQVAEQVHKGDRVVVIGQMKAEQWQTKDGDKRTSWIVSAYDVGKSLRWPPRDGQGPKPEPARQPYNPDEEPF